MKFIKTEYKRRGGIYKPDWETDNIWVEEKTRITSLRVVRDAFIQLAYGFICEGFSGRAILLLIEPNISYDRLIDEWAKAKSAFRPEILEYLSVVIYHDGQLLSIPDNLEEELNTALLEVCEKELADKRNPMPKPDYKAEIYKVLIYKSLMKEGAMTSDWISQTVGCNYRTVANTLDSVGDALMRHSDRSVELEYFPKEAWEWLLVHLDKSRMTKRYSDRSGQPRSIESLLKRLAKTGNDNIAVAGTMGAQHHYPDIDVIGIPRLDFTVHCPDKYLNIDFIEKLDPALKEQSDPTKQASVVVHFIRREKSFFTLNPNGVAWADPVECLLDLHEMRLEPQALDFINYLQNKRGV